MDFLRQGERLDDLQWDGLRIIQNPEKYCFTSDAVELANFVDGGSRDSACDLGAGSGVISLLLAKKKGMRVTAVEIQQDMADMCARSVALNGLESRIDVVNLPMQRIDERLARGSRTVVVCNPPYRPAGSGETQTDACLALSRHEIAVTLAEVIAAAAYLLPAGGRFYLVHRADRMAEVFGECCSRGLQPKVLQILRPSEGKAPHLFLLKCIAGGRAGLTVLPERNVSSFGK